MTQVKELGVSGQFRHVTKTLIRIFAMVGGANILLLAFLVLWCRWGKIARQIIEEDHLAWYQPFEALVTGIALIVAIATFVGDIHRKAKERNQERLIRQAESRKLQMALFSQTINYFMTQMKEFTNAQDKVRYKGDQGVDAIMKYLYHPYRMKEKAALEANNQDSLRMIDHDFLAKCQELKIGDITKYLWAMVNWVLYQQLLCEAFTSSERNDSQEVSTVRETFLSILDSPIILSPQLRWVYGKYRHLSYGITRESVRRSSYRGVDYIDRILLYRRTLELLEDGENKEQMLKHAAEIEQMEFMDLGNDWTDKGQATQGNAESKDALRQLGLD